MSTTPKTPLDVLAAHPGNSEMDDDNVVCPYCGAKYQAEAEDFSDDEREEECAECANCGSPATKITEDGINLCPACYALCPEDDSAPNTETTQRDTR